LKFYPLPSIPLDFQYASESLLGENTPDSFPSLFSAFSHPPPHPLSSYYRFTGRPPFFDLLRRMRNFEYGLLQRGPSDDSRLDSRTPPSELPLACVCELSFPFSKILTCALPPHSPLLAEDALVLVLFPFFFERPNHPQPLKLPTSSLSNLLFLLSVPTVYRSCSLSFNP